jgi:glycosyltransferase involved in cell wall biosynthesis
MSLIHKDKKIIAVLPAYNAARTLERTLKDIPEGWLDEIILVDDASRDGTAELARKPGLIVFEHEKNMGYGANQKTCYTEALKRGADIIMTRVWCRNCFCQLLGATPKRFLAPA